TLGYSGQTRLSGINNWEVYKAFFDQNKKVVSGLSSLAQIAQHAYQALKQRDFVNFFENIKQEGRVRADLFKGILTEEIRKLQDHLLSIDKEIGLKICGAGGGGCFIVIHKPQQADQVASALVRFSMTK